MNHFYKSIKTGAVCGSLLLSVILCGCHSAKSSSQESMKAIGGSDAAMGYTYSKVLDKKIRIFEEGICLLSAVDPNATMATYAVFSPDSSQVELFFPEETVVLDRRVRPNGTPVWNVEDDDTYMLEKKQDQWMVTRRGKLLYKSRP